MPLVTRPAEATVSFIDQFQRHNEEEERLNYGEPKDKNYVASKEDVSSGFELVAWRKPFESEDFDWTKFSTYLPSHDVLAPSTAVAVLYAILFFFIPLGIIACGHEVIYRMEVAEVAMHNIGRQTIQSHSQDCRTYQTRSWAKVRICSRSDQITF